MRVLFRRDAFLIFDGPFIIAMIFLIRVQYSPGKNDFDCPPIAGARPNCEKLHRRKFFRSKAGNRLNDGDGISSRRKLVNENCYPISMKSSKALKKSAHFRKRLTREQEIKTMRVVLRLTGASLFCLNNTIATYGAKQNYTLAS
jgi:hypothetical protein